MINHNLISKKPINTPILALCYAMTLWILFLLTQIISVYWIARILLPDNLNNEQLITLGATNGKIISLSIITNGIILLMLSFACTALFVKHIWQKHKQSHHNMADIIKTTQAILGLQSFSWSIALQSFITTISLMILQWIILSQTNHQPMLFMDELMTDDNLLWMILATTIIAPIYEEIIFRGAIFGFLQYGLASQNRHIIAIFVSSLLFVIVHLQYDLLTLSLLFLMALVWGYYRTITGSVFLTMLLHGINNGCAMAIYLLFGA